MNLRIRMEGVISVEEFELTPDWEDQILLKRTLSNPPCYRIRSAGTDRLLYSVVTFPDNRLIMTLWEGGNEVVRVASREALHRVKSRIYAEDFDLFDATGATLGLLNYPFFTVTGEFKLRLGPSIFHGQGRRSLRKHGRQYTIEDPATGRTIFELSIPLFKERYLLKLEPPIPKEAGLVVAMTTLNRHLLKKNSVH